MIRRLSLLALALLITTTTGCTVIRDPQPEGCVVETVEVREVEEGPSFDVQLHLEDRSFRYVNRGLENGPRLEQWQQWLEGHDVTLHVVRDSRHVARITLDDGTIVYDEFDDASRS